MKINKKSRVFVAIFIFVLVCLAAFGYVKTQHSKKDQGAKKHASENIEKNIDKNTVADVVPDTEEDAEPLQPVEYSETEDEALFHSEPDLGISQDTTEIQINEIINSMTLEEKVAQLFIILPEAITDVDVVVAAGDATKQAISQYPVGGFVYMRSNLTSAEQVKQMLANVQSYSQARIGLPMFLCVDEEGGTVTRIGNTGKFDVPTFDKMSEIGSRGDTDEAFDTGFSIGTYLAELGFNVDFAPVADVLTNSKNNVVKTRSFGSDPEVTSKMAWAFAEGLREAGVCNTYKHFPGHGATEGDTHEGYAFTMKTLEELRADDLYPFQAGIENGVDFIMVGHISLPNVVGDETPASMSKVIITDILREEMGYEGLVVTDALNMNAISAHYSSADAAKSAILAGADIILMPENFYKAYEGVLEAVQSGEITEERIDASLRRIIGLKLTLSDK